MKYCTLDDVKQEMKQFTISGTSKPTETEVESFIVSISEDEMEPQLREVVELPLSDTVGLKFLRSVAVQGVIAKIYESLQTDIERVQYHRNSFKENLKMAISRPSMLLGTVSSGVQGPTSSFTSTREERFPRDERQW